MPQQPLRTLEGIRILSFTQFLMGPAGVQYLNDLGADVIKVEPPAGAWERHWTGGNLYLNGESIFFMLAHRNNRSLTLNLKHPAAQEIARRLIASADVLVQNFRPGVMERLGLGYEQVKELNPRLIYVACSGYGENSPFRDLPGQDLIMQGLTGLANATGSDDGPPVPVGSPVIDQHGAALVGMGVLAALLERNRTGHGQKIEVSMVRAALDLQQEGITYSLNGYPVNRGPKNIASGFHPAPYGIFATRDGYMVLSMSPVERLNRVLQSAELKAFEDPEARFPARREISRIIAPLIKDHTTQEWRERFRPHDIWCAPVYTYEETFADPAVQYLKPVVEVQHPRAGTVKLLRHPIDYEAGVPDIRSAPPTLGEHTEEVLRELGLSDDEIAALRAADAI